MRPPLPLRTLALAIVVFGVLVLSALMSPLLVSRAPATPAASHTDASSGAVAANSKATTTLNDAAASLANGEGPAAGTSWSCHIPGSDSLSCSVPRPVSAPAFPQAPAPASRPAAQQIGPSASVEPSQVGDAAWYNSTFYTEFYNGGPVVYNASAAYDPYIESVVLFGGCSFVCPTNATWVYNGEDWINETAELPGHVPAVYGEGLVWDPAYGAVIMFGGVQLNGQIANFTWYFNGIGWTNITSIVGEEGAYPGGPNGTAFAAVAYDSYYGDVFVVGGCTLSCYVDAWNQWWYLSPEYGWVDGGFGPTSGQGWSFFWGASMAYDPVDQELVLFGGYSYFAPHVMNETYVFNASGWQNISSTSTGGGCFVIICWSSYPEGRAFADMTWDGQIGEIVLTQGMEAGGFPVNDTYVFLDGFWDSSSLFDESIPGPFVGYGGAMPTNSTDVAPFLIGGQCYVYCFDLNFVLDVAPEPYWLHVTPSPTDIGVVVNASVALTEGSGPFGLWFFYDDVSTEFEGAYFAYNSSDTYVYDENFSYASAGDVILSYDVYDFFGVQGYTEDDLTVHTDPVAEPVVGLTDREVGLAVDMTSAGTGGTAPFSYVWNFGDGVESGTANTSHVYTTAGTYTVTEKVTDGAGATSTGTVSSVTIAPAVTSAATATYTTEDVGLSDSFSANAKFGSGTYTYAWSFGDGGVSTAENPTHTYAATGEYTVDLTVTDSWGATAFSSTTVNVVAYPTGTISASTLTPNTKTSVTFTADASGGVSPFTYAWTFGDGGTGTGATTSWTYSAAGTYEVKVVMTDTAGGTVTKYLNVTVSKAPVSSLVNGLTSGTGLYVLIGVVVIIVAGAAVLLTRRKPKSPAPLTPAQPAATTPPSTPGAPGGGSPPPTPPAGAS